MQFFRILVVFLTLAIVATPEAIAAKKKDEFADTRVCVTLGLDTNHPLEKVCTRKVATVDAAKWVQQEDMVHFVFQRSGQAYKSGLIKEKMDGGMEFEADKLKFCVMEVPSFNGTADQAQARIDAFYLSYLFAALEKQSAFEDPESFRLAQRSKSGMFPEGCDVVAAKGEDWKGAWKKTIERVSLNSRPNTKFTQEFKQSFTDALSDLAVAFSLTPAEIEQGRVAGLEALGKRNDDISRARSSAAELVASGSEEGMAFLEVDGGDSKLCYANSDEFVIKEAIKASKPVQVMIKDLGIGDTRHKESLEDIFRGVLADECAAVMASPADIGKLKDSLAKRNVTATIGWSYIPQQEMAAAQAAAAEARRLAEIEAKEKAEQERLAAIELEKERAARAERQRLAAIERAKTHPYRAIVSCTVQGSHIHVMSCFDDTELKVTMNNRSRIYQAWEVTNAGEMRDNDLHIELTESFAVKAQNGRDGLTLGVIIMDQFGNVTYEDQAAMYQVVYVGND